MPHPLELGVYKQQVGLTENAALEYGPQKIRVNSVGPGFIRTPLLEKNLTPKAMALASDKASFVTGGYYAVDGGYLAQ